MDGCRSKFALAFATAVAMAALLAAPVLRAQARVTLNAAASPGTGQAGVNTITLTGTSYPTGTIQAADVLVLLEPETANAGPAVSATAATIALVIGSTRRVTFAIPASIDITAPTVYLASVSGRTTTGTTFTSSNTVRLTITPPARLVSVSPLNGEQASTASIVLGGTDTAFAQGATQATFGPGVSVGGGPVGGFGPVTVTSTTSAVAQIAIAPDAPVGPRIVTVKTNLQTATRADAFSVAAPAPPNRAPVVTSQPIVTATEAVPYSYQIAAVDPDGEPLSYVLTQFPAGMSVTPDGLVSWTPAANQTGAQPVSIDLIDPRGLKTTQSFTLTVAAANHPPTANAGGPYAGTVGVPILFNADGSSDPDAGDTLTYHWDFGDGTTADRPTPSHTYTTAEAYTVTLTIDDGRGGSNQAVVVIHVAAAPLGRGVIAQRVSSDRDGLPIDGASVQLVADPGGQATTSAVPMTDAQGRARVAAPIGPARIRVARSGFTAVERSIAVVDGKRVDPLDARLTPLDATVNLVSSVRGDTASNADGSIRIAIGAGALSDDTPVRITPISGQGLAALLPLGWAPIAAVDLFPGTVSLASAAQLSIAVPQEFPTSVPTLLARFDEGSGKWIAIGPPSRSADGTRFESAIARFGQYAVVVADVPPDNPADPIAGQPLAGVPPRAPPSAAAIEISPSPRILFAQADARSQVGVAAALPSTLPSGTPIQVELSESFAFASSAHLFPNPRTATHPLYSTAPGRAVAGLKASFAVSPSRQVAPFALDLGTIDLAVSMPPDVTAPRGVVIDATGGAAIATTGERLVIPAAAAAEDLPVVLSRLVATDLPAPLPAGFTFVGGVSVDFHGGLLSQPAQLGVPASGIPQGARALTLELIEADNVSYLQLVAAALVQGSQIVSSVDPLGDGSLPMPGVRHGGRYVFVTPAQPMGFVTGIVQDLDGSPLRGALVTTSSSPLVAITDTDGRYVIAGPIGAVQITATKLETKDSFVTNGTIAGADAVATVGVAVTATPPAVVSVTPASNAVNVPLSAAVRIVFSEAISPASVPSNAVVVTSSGGGVAGSLSFEPGNAAAVFRPSTLLASDTVYQVIVVATLQDLAGNPLGTPFASQFHTVDVTPPPPPAAGAISATIPDTNGTFVITGTQGTADPLGHVIVRNLTTQAETTITPNANGSFSGVIQASKSDKLSLVIEDAAKNKTPVAFPSFRNADGSVLVGLAGGRVEGPNGVAVDVPAGAVPDGTVVRLEAVADTQLPVPAPLEFPYAGALRIDLGGAVALKELKLSVPAPPGASAQEQILVGRPIAMRNGLRWTLVERAHLANGRYVTASPPFAGVVGAISGAVFSFFRPTDGCISFVNLLVDFGDQLVVQAVSDPFAFFTSVKSIVLAKRCESPIHIQVSDPDTDAVIQQIDAMSPAVNGAIGELPEPLTDDHTSPIVLSANTYNGQQVVRVEVRFSEPMDPQSIADNFHIEDAEGHAVTGSVELTTSNTVAIFTPVLAFGLGTQYLVKLDGATDPAGNPLSASVITFTPFDPSATTPFPLKKFVEVPALGAVLSKCANSSCATTTSSVRDLVTIGNTAFLANGLANASERYSSFPPQRLIAVDVAHATTPIRIGFTGRPPNPRALGAVERAQFTAADNLHFSGDLLLVASGGRILDNIEVAPQLEIYDVSGCRTASASANCLADELNVRKGRRFLGTPAGEVPRPGVPVESGVPQQVAVLHQRNDPQDDTVAAYVVVSGAGLEAVDVTKAFDPAEGSPATLGPEGFVRGDFLDVAVLKNEVVAVEHSPASGQFSLALFSAQLTNKRPVALPGPASRVAVLENVLIDVDQDGRVGSAENSDEDDGGTTLKATDELFDLAVVASGPLTDCPPNTASPCGALYVADMSALTTLDHQQDRGIISRIPLPGPAFSIAIDPEALLAYVEVRGKGLTIVDLSHLIAAVQPGGGSAVAFLDADENGIDDRILSLIPKDDIFAGRITIDKERGLAFVNGSISGLAMFQVASRCTELALDFNPNDTEFESADRTGVRNEPDALADEKRILLDILTRAGAALSAANPPITGISMLEQGSGACFWRTGFPASCTAFQAGSSDHDIEVFVTQPQVKQAQLLVDAFMEAEAERPGSELDKIGRLTLFAVSRESFETAELLNGTPRNRTGDPAGDLAMGRQLLLLLWILEGEYVTGFEGAVALDEVLARFKGVSGGGGGLIPGEPSAIPRLEGYEWSLLQELNFYKTGAMLRIAGACNAGGRAFTADAEGFRANDQAANFDDEDFLRQDCNEQIHTVAKAAIRAVLARLAANDVTNPAILDIDRDRYRSHGCKTGVDDVRDPPSDTGGYSEKACASFEEYIASLAVKSVDDQAGLFDAAELPLIFSFYCAKVGEHCADAKGGRIGSPLFQTDAEANRFIADAIAFIEATQAPEVTKAIYDSTLANDTVAIGAIPYLTEEADICATHGVANIGTGSPRSALRNCNRQIVLRKLNGNPAIQVDFPDPVHIVPVAETRKSIDARWGARNVVQRNLRVGALNLGTRTLANLSVKMYEGDGLDQADYRILTETTIASFPGGTRRPLEEDADGEPLFPTAFRTVDFVPNVPRAIAFFLDPDRRVPESDKKDNQAAFFYYLLDRAAPEGPPSAVEQPEFVIADVTPDPLCHPRPGFDFQMTARRLEDPPGAGVQELTVQIGQPIRFDYRVTNQSDAPLSAVTVRRLGVVQPVFGPATLPSAATSPGGIHGVEDFAPTGTGTFVLSASAVAQDPAGNTITSDSTRVRVTIVPAACNPYIARLSPDPNPVDENGVALSEIMKGGTLYRYYRVFDGTTGLPVANAPLRVLVKRFSDGQFFDLPPATTNQDGYIVHATSDPSVDDPIGLSVSADALGIPNERFEIMVRPGDGLTSDCERSFQVLIKDKSFSTSVTAGSSLGVAAKKIWGPFGLGGQVGIGFSLGQRNTGGNPGDLAFGRTINNDSKISIGATLKEWNPKLFGSESKMEAKGSAALSVLLMAQDEHTFPTPLSLESCLEATQLFTGTLFIGAFGVMPMPGATLVGLAIESLGEHLAGLDAKRTSVGGSIGIATEAGGSLSLPTLRLKDTGSAGLDDRGVTGSVSAAGKITNIAGLSYSLQKQQLTARLENRFGFDASGELSLGMTEVAGEITADEGSDIDINFFTKVISELKDGIKFSATISLQFSLVMDVTSSVVPPPVKQIVFTVTDKRNWGVTSDILDGTGSGDGGLGTTRKHRFVISRRDRMLEALGQYAVLQVLLGNPVAQLAMGPKALGRQMANLIAVADSYDREVETGVGASYRFSLTTLFKAEKLADLGLTFKYDRSVSHEYESGAIRRGRIFRRASYPVTDETLPTPIDLSPLDTLDACLPISQDTLAAAYKKVAGLIAKGAAAAKTLLPVEFSPSGADLLVDGAAEPNPEEPFEIELVAFPYKVTTGAAAPIQTPIDISGPSDRPHYGVGGFFQYAPDARPLAAPAQLTIKYLDDEVTTIDESTLSIYQWNPTRSDWDFLGGTVDAAANSVTVNVPALGMFTAAPPMPAGRIELSHHSTNSGTPQAPRTTTTYQSGTIRMNTGQVVPDGTMFTIRPLQPDTSELVPFGDVTTADEDPLRDGVQVRSVGGTIQFTAEYPGLNAGALVLVTSVHGTAIADAVIPF
jgi:PKD repeat protein